MRKKVEALLLLIILFFCNCNPQYEKVSINGNWFYLDDNVYYEVYIQNGKFTVMDDQTMGNLPISNYFNLNDTLYFIKEGQVISNLPYKFIESDSILMLKFDDKWIDLKKVNDTIDFYSIGDLDWEQYNRFSNGFLCRSYKAKLKNPGINN